MARHSPRLHAWLLAPVLLLAAVAPLLAQDSSIIPSAGSAAPINGNGDVAAAGTPRAPGQLPNPGPVEQPLSRPGPPPQASAPGTSRTSARTPPPARGGWRRASLPGCRPRGRGTSRVRRSLACTTPSLRPCRLWSRTHLPRAGRKVSDQCQAELAQFKIARAQHINQDVILGEQRARRAAFQRAARWRRRDTDPPLPLRSPGLQGRRRQAVRQRLGCQGPRQRVHLPQVRPRRRFQPSNRRRIHAFCAEPAVWAGARREHKSKLSSACQTEVFRVQQEVGALALSPRPVEPGRCPSPPPRPQPPLPQPPPSQPGPRSPALLPAGGRGLPHGRAAVRCLRAAGEEPVQRRGGGRRQGGGVPGEEAHAGLMGLPQPDEPGAERGRRRHPPERQALRQVPGRQLQVLQGRAARPHARAGAARAARCPPGSGRAGGRGAAGRGVLGVCRASSGRPPCCPLLGPQLSQSSRRIHQGHEQVLVQPRQGSHSQHACGLSSARPQRPPPHPPPPPARPPLLLEALRPGTARPSRARAAGVPGGQHGQVGVQRRVQAGAGGPDRAPRGRLQAGHLAARGVRGGPQGLVRRLAGAGARRGAPGAACRRRAGGQLRCSHPGRS
jgi:hypothetical protein